MSRNLKQQHGNQTNQYLKSLNISLFLLLTTDGLQILFEVHEQLETVCKSVINHSLLPETIYLVIIF